jgi:hypothetical protein
MVTHSTLHLLQVQYHNEPQVHSSSSTQRVVSGVMASHLKQHYEKHKAPAQAVHGSLCGGSQE